MAAPIGRRRKIQNGRRDIRASDWPSERRRDGRKGEREGEGRERGRDRERGLGVGGRPAPELCMSRQAVGRAFQKRGQADVQETNEGRQAPLARSRPDRQTDGRTEGTVMNT